MPGWFDFINGQTLPASRVQEFLMDQSVMKFADSGSRAAALPFPTDGMVSYLTDIDRLFVYRSSSSAWVQIAESTNLAALSSALPTRRNAIINGGFDIWQRGTSFAPPTSVYTANTADRWNFIRAGFAGGATVSRQTSTLTGLRFAARVQRDSGNTSTASMNYSLSLESADSVPLAGQQVVLSFYARAGANYSSSGSGLVAGLGSGTGTDQNYQSGFSGFATVAQTTNVLTTSWQRFTLSGTVSASATQLGLSFFYTPTGTAGANDWFEVTGVQLEAGSVVTPFVRAGGTLQGELAACQRYYYRQSATDINTIMSQFAPANTTTVGRPIIQLPVTMRVIPTSVDYSANLLLDDAYAGNVAVSSLSINSNSSSSNVKINASVASGLVAGRVYSILSNSTSAYVGLSAEL
jgi:hypothetical protein